MTNKIDPNKNMINLIDLGNNIILSPQDISHILINEENFIKIVLCNSTNVIISKYDTYEEALNRFNEIKSKLGITNLNLELHNMQDILVKPISLFTTTKCPKCGAISRDSTNCISITIPECEGEYCVTCWAKWIKDNIPKMESITE